MNNFVAWQRPAVYALTTNPPATARLAADLPITLHDDDGDLPPAAASFLLAGPGDVTNLARGQVTGRRPHPGCVDAEATMLAHVEIATPDVPWRYTPQPDAPGLVAVRPWLVLVVGTPSEVTLLDDGRVRLTSQVLFEGKTLFDWHPLTDAHRWSHVHAVADRAFSRVICPRKLATGTDYVAVLVPGWRAILAPDGTSTLSDSWGNGSGTVTLLCFDSWPFRTTTEQGDFASIAQRLEPLTDGDQMLLAEKQFGRARVEIGPVPGTVLGAGGALTVVPVPGEPPMTSTSRRSGSPSRMASKSPSRSCPTSSTWARLCAISWRSGSPVRRAFSGRKTAPSLAHANQAATIPQPFPARTITMLPLP